MCEGEGQRLLVVKGAPEAVLAACTAVEGADGASLPMTEATRADLLARAAARGGEGLRLLGIAWRPMPECETIEGPDSEAGLVFAGFCAFLDPPKPSAATAIARLGALGVRVKIVSGDAAPVLLHVVASLGLAWPALQAAAAWSRGSRRWTSPPVFRRTRSDGSSSR
ncbi:hypothetical protein [Sediminicoccus sp. BL-A-41-H5]|uniref:hypothetical protein n=1 Tax=Sediminicoccus sp. BL-A-41-H5 TaxID=3421106 RepID=UPI003D66D564